MNITASNFWSPAARFIARAALVGMCACLAVTCAAPALSAAQCGDYVVSRMTQSGDWQTVKRFPAHTREATLFGAFPLQRDSHSQPIAPQAPCNGPLCQRAPDHSPAPFAPAPAPTQDHSAVIGETRTENNSTSQPWEIDSRLALCDGFLPRIDEPPR